MDEEDLVRVPVGLNLTVDALIDGTPETKGIMEPEEDADLTNYPDGADQIKNIVVLQFNGITSTARLVGGQTYFDHWPLTGDEKLTLVASAEEQTVVVLANTFDRISITSNTTLGDFLTQDYTTIGGLSGVLTSSGGNDYFRLSGSQYLPNVSGVTNVTIALKRNVAKIVVNVKNTSAGANPPVTISQVQLRGINVKYYYLAHIGTGLSVEFSDSYNGVSSERFDDSRQDFPAANNLGGASATAVTYTYYVPANLRGTTSNTQQYSKSQGAPDGATRFCIYGSYGGSNTPINYTYYLGENLTNDFNILPNYKYTYNITINSKGNPNYDYRIEDMGEVKFETDANCYMLHPPSAPGQSRIYAIPVRRAAMFWNEPNQGGVYGARLPEDSIYGTNVLLSDSDWDAEVLWSDFDMTEYMVTDSSDPRYADRFLQVASGSGYDPTQPATHTDPYFKVKIHSGMSGNVVVGIKKRGETENVLWSWHLWITDYNPDKYVVPVSGKYIYGVDNGEIHRYNNAEWDPNPTPPANPGKYANGFAMDRNLGSYGVRSNGLQYEFGKKDPYSTSTFYLGGTTSAVVMDSNHRYSNTTRDIRYAVNYPMVKIDGYDWVPNTDTLRTSTVTNWYDPKFGSHDGNQAIFELKKSIYDPCPSGWKVPSSGCYGGFGYATDSNRDSQTYTAEYKDSGIYYYPEGYINRESTGSIYFRFTPYRIFYSWSLTYNQSFYWLDSSGSVFVFWSTGIQVSSFYRGSCMSVRCVRE